MDDVNINDIHEQISQALADAKDGGPLAELYKWQDHIVDYFKADPLRLLSVCLMAPRPVIETLLDMGVPFGLLEKRRSESPCLLQAVRNPDPGVFMLFVERGADVNMRLSVNDPTLKTALSECIECDMALQVMFLIDHNKTTADKVLFLAEKKNAEKIAQALIERDPALLDSDKIQKMAQRIESLGAYIEKRKLDRCVDATPATKKASPRCKRI